MKKSPHPSEMKFDSERRFKLWVYMVSHSVLILRSPKESHGRQGSTIDVEFWSVAYIDLPRVIDGLEIEVVQGEIPEKFNQYLVHDHKLFRIRSNDQNERYLVAGGCVVGESSWEYDHDRFSAPDLDYDRILKRF